MLELYVPQSYDSVGPLLWFPTPEPPEGTSTHPALGQQSSQIVEDTGGPIVAAQQMVFPKQ
ncbi:hypothetical protein SBA4_7060003 [Candidatus Sulfopaludibacter sp. SbA4]|nr:hypothetical protein SBA4_7060003 [Candidatus Sulfopaludibacter sp. SbA4]